MEPGRRYASEYGKLCGTLDSVGVNGFYNLFLYAQVSNNKLPAQKGLFKYPLFICDAVVN